MSDQAFPPLRFSFRCIRSLLAGAAVFAGCAIVSAVPAPLPSAAPGWVGTWATSPRAEPGPQDQALLAGATLRQVVRTSLGGRTLRLRLDNTFGVTPLAVAGVHFALAGAAGSIRPGTDRELLFAGRPDAVVPSGGSLVSDPFDFDLAPLADVAVSIRFRTVPAVQTMHHGSRTTSYLVPGDALAAPDLPGATRIEHWYFLGGLDVVAVPPAGAVVALGDSITDGRGSTTDHNDRWTDALSQRLQGRVGILNQGIGGNRLLRDGLGASMLARLDRDVLDQTGVRWLIVQGGINDIGTRLAARKRGEAYASAADIIGALTQIIDRAHARGLRVIGTTITPYAGADFYWSPDGEADRAAVNEWIRTGGRYDAVADFDAAVRDPAAPTHLAAAFDSGDHLHLSPAGYAEMARAVDLSIFDLPPAATEKSQP